MGQKDPLGLVRVVPDPALTAGAGGRDRCRIHEVGEDVVGETAPAHETATSIMNRALPSSTFSAYTESGERGRTCVG